MTDKPQNTDWEEQINALLDGELDAGDADRLRAAAETLDPEQTTVTYCNKGTTGNAAQNILLGKGFKHVYSLSGGQKQYKKTHRK